MARWPVHTACAGVVVSERAGRVDGTLSQAAATPRTVDRRGPDVVLPWASVTKLLVALSVLVAAEEGTLSLDDPAGPPGSTVRHLLAHASGLDVDGTQIRAAPGSRRIYSNVGYEQAADVLASRSGLPFRTYLREAVLEPLHMDRTTLPERSSPASGAEGPLSDLLALASELLVPTLVAPATLAAATAPVFPGLAGVLPGFGWMDPCDWGLGFEIKDAKVPHWTGAGNDPTTFGHFGRSGSFVWVDPHAGVALAALADRNFGAWAKAAWPQLADAALAEVARRYHHGG